MSTNRTIPPSTHAPSGQAIPYQIIRRDDGLIALSCNAGILHAPPAHCAVLGDEVQLLDATSAHLASMLKVPKDATDQLQSNGGIHFLEFLSSGPFSSAFLKLR